MTDPAPVICLKSGLTIPECACPTCITAQVAEHAPHLLDDPPEAA